MSAGGTRHTTDYAEILILPAPDRAAGLRADPAATVRLALTRSR